MKSVSLKLIGFVSAGIYVVFLLIQCQQPEIIVKTKENSDSFLDSGPRYSYLESFYDRLEALEQNKVGVVRVLYHGDSMIWNDKLTNHLRLLLQQDFGDGGRGLVDLVPVNSTRLKGHFFGGKAAAFQRFKIPFEWFSLKPLPNLGFGAISFRARFKGAKSIHARPPGSSSWQNIGLIMRAPELPAQKQIAAKVRATFYSSTGNVQLNHEIKLESRECKLIALSRPAELKQINKAELKFQSTKTFIDGLFFESDHGISLSVLPRWGLHLAWQSAIPRHQRDCGLRAYEPDLIIYQYGINESASMLYNYKGFDAPTYERQLTNYLTETRAALPDTPILIIGPHERLLQRQGKWIVHPKHEKVRMIQQKVARKLQLAWFDSYRYLGGAGQMMVMARRGFVMHDYMHLNQKGSDHLAEGIYKGLISDYRRYQNE